MDTGSGEIELNQDVRNIITDNLGILKTPLIQKACERTK